MLYQHLQKTLKKTVSCQGIGVHSGDNVQMELCPAPAYTGIVFERTDLPINNKIKARWDHVVDTMLCTRLANNNGVTIGTVEHLMAALFACGIDNLIIKVNNAELPIMDGSAEPFIALIKGAGIVTQETPRRYIKVTKPVMFIHKDCVAALYPADTLSVQFTFDFKGKTLFPVQEATYTVDQDNFDALVASARTFGVLEEVNKLWDAGLAKGGSLDNAVVVSGDKILNEGGLRYEDEFVRHKILDAIGDLYLAGPLIGRFEGVNAGHWMNNQLLKTLFAHQDHWELLTLDQQQSVENSSAKASLPHVALSPAFAK